jgi:hypothetical protein
MLLIVDRPGVTVEETTVALDGYRWFSSEDVFKEVYPSVHET